MIKLLHVIVGLDTGGAEMMLFKLLSHLNRDLFAPKVISLRDVNGPVAGLISKLDISLMALGMKRSVPDPTKLVKLARIFHREKPDLVQTWMYHSDLMGGMAAKFNQKIPVIWGIRHSNLTPESSKRMTYYTAKMCAALSGWLPEKIVCNSQVSKNIHGALGYNAEKMIVIPNGFDLTAFRPDLGARNSVRREFNIPEDAFIIGCVGRFHPEKDHHSFFQAAALLNQQYKKDVYYLLCGNGITWENQQLAQWIEEANVRSRTFLLGRRDDINRITASMDIATSSSAGESFSNVIGEAMACEVPCVVTNVGDSSVIVGDTGMVVPPEKPGEMAKAWAKMIDMHTEERAQLGTAARERIMEHYNLPGIVHRFEDLYKDILHINPEAKQIS